MLGRNVKDVSVSSLWEEFFLWEYFGINKTDLKTMSNKEKNLKLWFCRCMQRKKKQKIREMELRSKW